MISTLIPNGVKKKVTSYPAPTSKPFMKLVNETLTMSNAIKLLGARTITTKPLLAHSHLILTSNALTVKSCTKDVKKTNLRLVKTLAMSTPVPQARSFIIPIIAVPGIILLVNAAPRQDVLLIPALRGLMATAAAKTAAAMPANTPAT